MRRNLRNEILIAVGGLSVIICGLIFAIILSGTGDSIDSTPPGTSIAESNTDDAKNTLEATATLENTDTSEPKNTEAASDTPEPTETDIPSDTPELKNTEEVSNTPEPTETNIPSDTPEPKNTEVASDTPEPTETDIPSDTPESINTEVASDTPAPVNTSAPVPTDSTIKATPAQSNPTATIIADFTGIIPTLPPSPTVIPPDEPTRTPASCRLPRGWTRYSVQSGDTLFAISLATNSTVDELRFANCIDNIDNITAGDTIFVPIAPVRPVSTTVPSGIRGGLSMIGCSSPATQITSPITAQRVRAVFNVFGTATRPDFQYYKIEVRPDFADIYNFYSDSQSQVVNGNLGQINAELFGPGLHWIRLSVVDLRASIPADGICEIPVIFE